MNKYSKIIFTFFCLLLCSGFVLLSGPTEAHMDATEDFPVVSIHWDGSAPPLEDIGEYRDGALNSLDTAAAMQVIIEDAFEEWNNVPGAFIQLNLVRDNETEISSLDRLHSIRVESLSNAAAAAFAVPSIQDGLIVDCDITLGSQSVSARSIAYTILHEVGHCLGLGHAHTNYGAVMGYSRSSRMLTLGLDDMAGLIYLYPAKSPSQESLFAAPPPLCGLTVFGLWFFLIPFLSVFCCDIKKHNIL